MPMSPPGTLETLGGGLALLLRGLLGVFILSLAVERLALVFQRRDWQPLRPRRRPGSRAGRSVPIQVDLRRGEAYVAPQSGPPVVLDDQAVERLLRAAHAENTLFIGGLLALLVGANAFLGSFGWPEPSALRGSFVVQVLLTGAASAAGASLWGAVLDLLAAWRSRASRLESTPEGLSPLLPGRPLTPLAVHEGSEASAMGPLERLRAAASLRLPELQALPGVKRARLVDAPRRGAQHPCLEFRVELQPGASASPPTELRVSVGGVEHVIPVRT